MSKYQDLQAEYTRLWQDEIDHWSGLSRVAQEMHSHFAAYLGVDLGAMVDIQGDHIPVLEIGRLDLNREFVAASVPDLERNNRGLEVAFRLNFRLLTTPMKTTQRVFFLTLDRVGNGYSASVSNPVDAIEIPCPPYKALFDYLLER